MAVETEKEPVTKRSRRRWWFIGALIGLIIAILLTGLPQRMVAEHLAAKALGAQVRIRGLSLMPSVRIAELDLADPGQGQGFKESAVSLRGVQLDWVLSSRRGLRFPSLHIDAVNVHLRMAPDGKPANYAFLERLFEPSEPQSSFNPLLYLPNAIAIDEIGATIHSPEVILQLSGLALDFNASSLRDMSARLHGAAVGGRLGPSSGGEETAITNGLVDVKAEVNDRTLDLTAFIHLADRLDVDANGRLLSFMGISAASVHVNDCRLRGKEWAALVPVPLRFDDLEVSECDLQLFFARSILQMLRGDVRARGTSVQYGRPGHEWYDGNIDLTAEFRGNHGLIDAVLNNGQHLSLAAEGNKLRAQASAKLRDWSRADLDDALPKDWRPLLAEVPHLSTITGSAELDWLAPTYDVEVTIDPVFQPGAGPAERFALALDGGGSRDPADGDLFHGKFSATLGAGAAHLTVDANSVNAYTADLTLAKIDLGRWLVPLEQRVSLPLPDGTLDGSAKVAASPAFSGTAKLQFAPRDLSQPLTLSLEANGDTGTTMFPVTSTGTLSMDNGETPGKVDFRLSMSKPDAAIDGQMTLSQVDVPRLAALFHLDGLPEGTEAVVSGNISPTIAPNEMGATLDVTAGPAVIAGIAVPAEHPLALQGALSYNRAKSRLHSKKLVLQLTDDAHLDVDDLDAGLSPFSFSGHVTGKVDFDYVGPILGYPIIVGALTVDAPLHVAGDTLQSQFRLEGDGFGYERWAGPYGTPVALSGAATYSLQDMHGTIENLGGTWGKGSTLTSSTVSFGFNPLVIDGPFHLDTDLAPLVDLRFLDAAEGTASVTGSLGYGSGARTDVNYTIAANSFILRNALAAFAGLSSAGSMNYEDTMDGQGGFAAADAAAFGAVLDDPTGTCTIEDGVATMRDGRAGLYGGRVTFDAEYNLLDSTAGGRIEAHFEDVDLDRFTKEYEPPGVRLTGIADGDALVAWNSEGLRELRVDLASDQDFSMNREMVENLLLQSLTSGVTGLKALNKRIQKRTIGDQPQRAFDSATASLSLEGEDYENQRLVGPVVLKSETLDFAIDVGVDLRAIADALEIQQQAQLADGDTISAEPVQWKLPAEKAAEKPGE